MDSNFKCGLGIGAFALWYGPSFLGPAWWPIVIMAVLAVIVLNSSSPAPERGKKRKKERA